MTPFALSDASVLTPTGPMPRLAVLVRDGRIEAIVPDTAVPAEYRRENLQGGLLVPGFIDVQVNGGGGVLLNDAPSREGMAAIARAHLKFGSTGIMPTLISDDLAIVAKALDAADAAVGGNDPGVLGIHVEGPFLNAGKRGIHNAEKFRNLDEAALALLTKPGPARRMVTLAPELAPPGAIARLTRAGVIVCAGHSLATYDQTRAALADGLAGFTHLFNAMTQLEAREPGMVGAALEDRNSFFGLIVDGVHVHPATLRLALAAGDARRAMLVTDAMPTVGSSNSTFLLGQVEIHADGDACRSDDGTLAGSNLDMATAFRNTMALLGVNAATASAMASQNPARFLGLPGDAGSISPGVKADLVHLDDALAVQHVWQSGVPVSP